MTSPNKTSRGSRLLWLLAFALAAGCGRGERWNVLLVTFDTTRADHLGCYGNDSIRTPNVDRLAAEGVRFARAFSAIPLTTPSHSTIMTGKYPIGHGVRDNGMFVLSDRQETLAEILKQHGWSTAAAIGAFPLIRKFGVDQGFELYDDRVGNQYMSPTEPRLPKAKLFFDERPAARVNEALYPWLEEHHEERFFVWAHYFDPHHPLAPPPPYDQLYSDNPYEGEIAYTDESFGTLLEHLRRLGVYDRTLVILAADHGEGLGEHRELTHSLQLYNSTLHVPLIVRVPGGRAGAVVDTPVGIVDILPTILDLFDLPLPEGVHGRSLVDELEGNAAADPPDLYAETLSPRFAYQWGELRALYSGGRKFIFGPRPELFDFDDDPRELRDLIEAEPETAARLQHRLSRFLRDNAAADLDAAVEMDEDTRQRLMALGYIGGAGGSTGTIEEVLRPGGIPPQDRVSDTSDFSQIKQLLHSNHPLPALEGIRTLVEKDPENALYLELEATANLQLGRLDRAIEILRKIREQDAAGLSTGRLLLQLGSIYFFRGDYQQAEELLRESLAVEPSAMGHYMLANVYSALGQRPRERTELEAALEVEPAFAPARVDLAIRQAQEGDSEAAAASFRRAMSDSPYFPKTFYNYGAFLASSGELTAAVENLRRAVELEPAYWQAYVALIRIHLALGEPQEARSYYQTLASRAPAAPETATAAQLIEEAS